LHNQIAEALQYNMNILEPIKNWIENNPKAGERLLACNDCNFYKQEASKCEICGCYMYAKVLLPNATCPVGKW
jgi:hypothetical protein